MSSGSGPTSTLLGPGLPPVTTWLFRVVHLGGLAGLMPRLLTSQTLLPGSVVRVNQQACASMKSPLKSPCLFQLFVARHPPCQCFRCLQGSAFVGCGTYPQALGWMLLLLRQFFLKAGAVGAMVSTTEQATSQAVPASGFDDAVPESVSVLRTVSVPCSA